jgi:hypothetical protein
MREIAHNWISPVRIKVNASRIAAATASAGSALIMRALRWPALAASMVLSAGGLSCTKQTAAGDLVTELSEDARPFLLAEELNASLMNLLYFFFCLVVDGNGG